MKYLFLIIALLLGVLSVGTYLSFPGIKSDVPVIYWMTDRNAARDMQVEGFHQWLVDNGHVTDQGKPVVELRLDITNDDVAKKIIQAVSGIGSDVMDTGGSHLQLLQTMGVLEDITELAKEQGFDPSQTYKAMLPEITIEGRQFVFPRNIYVMMLWVNKDLFKQYGISPPPSRWTWDEFEAIGKAFVAKANVGRKPGQRVFFVDFLHLTQMPQSMGLSVFNETLTGCDLGDARFARCLERVRQWTYEDHLLPTADDMNAFNAVEGYGGAATQLFHGGNFAMIQSDLSVLTQLRKFEPMNLDVVELPNGGYPTAIMGARSASIYAGSKHKKLAALFLKYLTSERYNMQLVREADALPPDPRYTQTELFKRPPDYPNEWGVHEKFHEVAMTIANGYARSPFVLSSVVQRETSWFSSLYDNGEIAAMEAAMKIAQAVDRRIADNIARDPKRKVEFDRRIAIQKQIDTYMAAGRKLPAAWILNPFYRET
ncbi:MAG TPA: hypothetical protein DCM28_11150 [Phycisphaerales bacterium]|nr:hypothetical protein [Phycisphaerales bacterium]